MKVKRKQLLSWFHQAGERFQKIYNESESEKVKELINKAEKIHHKLYSAINKEIEAEKC